MKIAFAGVAHWHTRHYVGPVLAAPDLQVVGVQDPDADAAGRWAASTGSPAYADLATLCEEARPDLVFALGRHSAMAATGMYLANAGIPFALEKPCGSTLAEIEALAGAVARHHAFAAVPFSYRYSPLVDLLKREVAASGISPRASLRFVSGPAGRYAEVGCGWVLNRDEAGGGCTANLAVHLMDLLLLLWPAESWSVRAAAMRTTPLGDVEDYSAILLSGDSGGMAVVESGYSDSILTKGPLDIAFGIDTGRSTVRCESPDRVSVIRDGRLSELEAYQLKHTAFYPNFVLDTVRRVSEGMPPLSGLPEMVAVGGLIDAAYRMAGRTFGRPVPHA